MKQTLKAIYKNGVFKPLDYPEIPEGQQVRLEAETITEKSPEDLPELAALVYRGLSNGEIAEIEQIALNHRDFFGERLL